jgi:hypothetical protein
MLESSFSFLLLFLPLSSHSAPFHILFHYQTLLFSLKKKENRPFPTSARSTRWFGSPGRILSKLAGWCGGMVDGGWAAAGEVCLCRGWRQWRARWPNLRQRSGSRHWARRWSEASRRARRPDATGLVTLLPMELLSPNLALYRLPSMA